jgi:hypothetical protein
MVPRPQLIALAILGSALFGCQSPVEVSTSTGGNGGVGTGNRVGDSSLSIVGPSEIRAKGRYTWTVRTSRLPVPCQYRWLATYLESGQRIELGPGPIQSLLLRQDDGDLKLGVSLTCLPASQGAELLVVNHIGSELK